MKEQLVTSIKIVYASPYTDFLEMVMVGEVFYMRQTRILKRSVRKVIHKVEVSLDFVPFKEAKQEVRHQLDAFVKRYYND